MQFLKTLGHWSQLGQYRKLPELKLHDLKDHWVRCPVCRGTGQNCIPQNNGRVDLFTCPNCNGRKTYYNGSVS